MSTYAVSNETVQAVHEAAASDRHDEARDILKVEMEELTDQEIEDLLRMILVSPFKPKLPR
ncbi:MAG: hypothetical protein WCJ64_23630 [Rhodospirillaceae bacterium]